MKEQNISTAILSISSPGTYFTPGDDQKSAEMTRQFNKELSDICAKYPDRFKFFASLPLPSVPKSLAEIDYDLDRLGAVGFVLYSNANGVYLGDPSFDKVFAKLDEREAIVFMHPTSCNLLLPRRSGPGKELKTLDPLPYPRPVMEFMFDETRAVANLLLSGTVSKYRNIKFIMSHCGCALPPIIDRICAFDSIVHNKTSEFDLKELLRTRFFFDLAGVPFPNQIHGLLRFLGIEAEKRLLYGSDYPFTPERAVVHLMGQMEEGFEGIFEQEERNDVYIGNARALFGLKG